MATLRFPPATSISFVVDTGTGTINNGVQQSPEQSYFTNQKGEAAFESDGFAEYWNWCGDEVIFFNPCQIFECADNPTFQFFHATNDDTPWVAAQGTNPIIGFLVQADDENTVIDSILMEALSDTPGVKGTIPVLTGDDCPSCARVALYTIENGEGLSNEWTCADNGTWETSGAGTTTGANNTVTRQGLIFRSGAWGGSIESGVAPAAGDELIIACSISYSFSTGDIVYITGYVQELSSVDNFTGAADTVSWDTSDFTDASTLYEVTAEPTATEDTWLEVTKIIRIGTDTMGDIRLDNSATPQASGFIYVDDMTVYVQQTTRQAISQCIEFKSTACDTLLATYSADSWAFGQVFGSEITFENTLRLGWPCSPASMGEFRFKEDKGESFRDSNGQGSITGMRTVMVRSLTIANVPPYMVEKICLAMKHQNLTIQGYDYVAEQKELDPEWVEKQNGMNANLLFELTPVNYDQKEDKCT